MAAANTVGEKLPARSSSLTNQQDQGVLLASETSPADTDLKRRVGWTVLCLRSGSGSSIKKFLREGRNFFFLGLSAIQLVFLPTNTTSKTQPIDKGVLRSLKAHYRTLTVELFIRAVDNN